MDIKVLGPGCANCRNTIALIELDQPCLAEREVRHFAEPIVLLAHPDRDRLLKQMREVLSNRTYVKNIVSDLVATIG